MSTELEVVSKALSDINAVSTGIADLTRQYGGVVYEVTTTAGMEDAKAARLAIRTPRYEVERIRKAAKAPILALGKRLDNEAARIAGELLKIEGPIDQQIKAEEDRKEEERQAKINAELKRVADLQERVAELRGNMTLHSTSGSALIAEHIADLQAIPVDASFQEFEQQATDAKASGIARLQALHLAATIHEEAQAKLKAEQEELARFRAQAAKEAAEQKARQDEENRKERDRLAAVEVEAKRLSDAEAAKLASDRAELTRQQEELRKAQEPPKPTLTSRGAAVRVPSFDEMVDVLAKHYRAHPDTIVDWLLRTDFAHKLAAA